MNKTKHLPCILFQLHLGLLGLGSTSLSSAEDCCRHSEHCLESCWEPGHGLGLVAGQIHTKQNDGKVVLGCGKGCVSLLHSQELPGIFAMCPETKLILCIAVAIKAVLLVQVQREGGCRHVVVDLKRAGCSSRWFSPYFWRSLTQLSAMVFTAWEYSQGGHCHWYNYLLTILFTFLLNCFRAWHRRTEKVTAQ